MERTRIKLAVYVDLDPVPGAFHSADSARNILANLLNNNIEHYKPTVSIESYHIPNEHTIVFDRDNVNWAADPTYNLLFLKNVQAHLNHRLALQGHLFLNDVFDEIRLPRMRVGAVTGWHFDKEDPSWISFENMEQKDDGSIEFTLKTDGEDVFEGLDN